MTGITIYVLLGIIIALLLVGTVLWIVRTRR